MMMMMMVLLGMATTMTMSNFTKVCYKGCIPAGDRNSNDRKVQRSEPGLHLHDDPEKGGA